MPNYSEHIFVLNKNRCDKIALVDENYFLTYKELELHVSNFASYLQSCGLQPQNRVILYFDDCVEWPVAFLSCIMVGLNPVCVSHNNTVEKLEYIIDLVDAKAIISDKSLNLKNIRQFKKNEILQAKISKDIKIYDFHDDEPCFWLMTSGTTGHPKVIVHRHANLLNFHRSTREVYQTNTDNVIFSTAKLSFAYGLSIVITVSLPVGATIYLMSGIASPGRIFDVVSRYSITHLYIVPTVINSILKHSKNQKFPPSFKYVFSAGETLPAVISKEFYDTFNILVRNSIGMSETTGIYCIQSYDNYEHGTLGEPIPGIECRLVDNVGNIIEDDSVGEMYVKTPCMADQYWKDWKYTKHTFKGEWLKTGDQMKKLPSGNYFYVSRTDDQIKINGQWVSAIEIEAVLMGLKEIYDCAVVFRDTEVFPEIHAFIVLKQEAMQVDLIELQNQLSGKLPYFKKPKKFHVIDEIPKTITNKTKRHELYARLNRK